MKEITNYEGLYSITQDGQVWSHYTNKYLKPTIQNSGYYTVMLCKDKQKKRHLVHRLVAETYLPNPDSLEQVNHKDECKTNNNVSNLEWVDRKTNMNYGTCAKRSAEKRSKQIYCVELDKIFSGQREAARELNLNQSNITKCCKGVYHQTGGYHFRYAEEVA